MIRDWPHRAEAERLRQWPALMHVADRVAESAALDGLLLIGSFASGRADDLSDVDFIVVVGEGRFAEAWQQRVKLQTPDVLVAWDWPSPNGREAAGHKWLTRDLVLVECALWTPSSEVRLADPFVVLVGEESLGDRFARRPEISREELEEFAQERKDDGTMPEVERRYGELARAARAARIEHGLE
jgi:predicted nucleotidyltransferase